MPFIEVDLGLDHGQAGTLFLFIALGYFIALMASGYFSSRLKHRNTIVLSAVTLGLAFLATSLSHSVCGLRLGVLVMGMAAGLYFPSGMATITSLFQSQHWGKAIAVHELAPNLALVTAPLLSEILLPRFSWNGTLALVGLASLGLGLAFMRFGRGGEFPGQAPAFGFLRTLSAQPVFWIMVVLFSLGISSTVGLYAMLPLFLISERGMDPDWANTIVALSRVPTLGTALLGGWVADRVGPKKTMIWFLLLTGIATLLLGLAPPSWTVVLVFLQAMMSVSFFPAALAALSSIGLAGNRNVVISFTIPFAFLAGAGATPALIGMLGKEGAFGWGIGLVGVFMIVGTVLSIFLKLPHQQLVGSKE
jgi:MFS transporter, NNP family, nitrate/nitrite transporter